MIYTLLFFFLTQLSQAKLIFQESLPNCSPGIINANCETVNTEFTPSDPLISYFYEFNLNANINFKGCSFKNFQSQVNNVAGIIYISSEQSIPFIGCFQNCNFENNFLSSPILSISNAKASFDTVIFTDNTINQGSMIKLNGELHFMISCQFVKNEINHKAVSFQDSTSASSLISISNNGLIKIQNCCFFVNIEAKENFVFNTDKNSQITISQNTIFNCPINQALSNRKKKSALFKFDETTIYSGNKCNLQPNTNLTDPSDPPSGSDDKESKISKYLYIGIGAAAGIIIIGILIFLIFRMAGKCKKLEHTTDEGLELSDKRTTYLLQDGEQEEEILQKQEDTQTKEETHPKEEE